MFPLRLNPSRLGPIPLQTLRVTRLALRCWRLCAAAACLCHTLRDLACIWSHGRTPIFSGRARRRKYWPFALGNLVVVFLAVSSLADPVPPEQENLAQTALIAICGLAALAAFLTTGVRRMHDSGHSGWWFLCPLVNVYFTLIDGDRGVNRFGPEPRRRDPQATWSPAQSGS